MRRNFKLSLDRASGKSGSVDLTHVPVTRGLQKVWLENGYSVKKGLAAMVGVTEQNVSLWERQGKIPRYASRLVKLCYLGHIDGDVKVSEMIQNLIEQDDDGQDDLRFKAQGGHWKEAA